MIKKDKVLRKGVYKTHIRVVEGYYDENKRVKQRTIKTFGYLEDQVDQVSFMKEVQTFNDEFFKSKVLKKIHLKYILMKMNIMFNIIMDISS